MFGSRYQSYALVFGQIGWIVVGFSLMAVVPPRVGMMLLVPITAQGRARLLPTALARGASLVAPGPIAGSYIVFGERTRLAPAPYDDGVLAVAASASLCGIAT